MTPTPPAAELPLVDGGQPEICWQEHEGYWIREKESGAELYRDGKWRLDEGYGTDVWPTREAAEQFILKHADPQPPAVPAQGPAVQGERGLDLPDDSYRFWERWTEYGIFGVVDNNVFNGFKWSERDRSFCTLNCAIDRLPRGNWHRAAAPDGEAEIERLKKRVGYDERHITSTWRHIAKQDEELATLRRELEEANAHIAGLEKLPEQRFRDMRKELGSKGRHGD